MLDSSFIVHHSSFQKESAVADEAQDTPRPFDITTIEALVRLMAQNDLSEIDLHDGNQRIRLRRGARIAAVSAPVPVPVSQLSTVSPTPTSPTTPATPASNLIEIKSEGVGTFYAQDKPGSAPYVTIGSRVTPTTIVGKIDAMKVFTEIPAGISGVIREIVVKDGEFIDFNTVLFRVDPSA
jgi:acetyl-CoA carboxylase biotin carboxyl carrier protein